MDAQALRREKTLQCSKPKQEEAKPRGNPLGSWYSSWLLLKLYRIVLVVVRNQGRHNALRYLPRSRRCTPYAIQTCLLSEATLQVCSGGDARPRVRGIGRNGQSIRWNAWRDRTRGHWVYDPCVQGRRSTRHPLRRAAPSVNIRIRELLPSRDTGRGRLCSLLLECIKLLLPFPMLCRIHLLCLMMMSYKFTFVTIGTATGIHHGQTALGLH